MAERYALYVRDWCWYCSKVRRAMKDLGLELPIRDIAESHHREALIGGGGMSQVPCLRIDHPNGRTEWMYESDDIIRYLKAHAAA